MTRVKVLIGISAFYPLIRPSALYPEYTGECKRRNGIAEWHAEWPAEWHAEWPAEWIAERKMM